MFKKIFILFFSFLLVGCNILPEDIYKIKTPEQLEEWLQDNCQYCSEKGIDIWQTPNTTIARKKGDCEDFAILSYSILKKLGYEAKIFMLDNIEIGQSSHAICIYKEKDNYYFFSNQKLYKLQYKSVKELIESFYPEYEHIYEVNTKISIKNIYKFEGKYYREKF